MIDGLSTAGRNEWPMTVGFDHQREVISYREVIWDRQGRFASGQDQSYRRFDSVREGRTRR